MKPIKYIFLARLIKGLFRMLILFCVINFCFNIYIDLFSKKSNIKHNGWSMGYDKSGYNFKASLTLNIPDSVYYYRTGNSITSIYNNSSFKKTRSDTLDNIIVNKFNTYANKNISLRNDINEIGNVSIRAISKNKFHNVFWALTNYLSLVTYCIIILILIKLTNRYIDGEIFHSRTFKLITWLGIILITGELIDFIINMVNMLLIQSPVLTTASILQNKTYDFIQVNLHPASINHSNLIIGLLTMLLAQVFKQAIIIKHEQDLTI